MIKDIFEWFKLLNLLNDRESLLMIYVLTDESIAAFLNTLSEASV